MIERRFLCPLIILDQKERQTLLFSATMPDTIVKLANRMLTDYTRVEVTPPATTVERGALQAATSSSVARLAKRAEVSCSPIFTRTV